MSHLEQWPSLPLDEWKNTYETLHRWTQIVGKIRLQQEPWVNHSWHVTLHPTANGLTTLPMRHGKRTFQIDFDFLNHRLVIRTSDGHKAKVALVARTVADFYREIMRKLEELDLPVRIHTTPNELEDATPLDVDETHRYYDAEYTTRWWRIVAQSACVFNQFRARFLGKSSPTHFFWGSFDLAVTRFSGRRAPPHPGGVPNLPDWVAREAYSHEVSSLGFWPGGGPTPFALFYSYAYPEPDGFAIRKIQPEASRYDTNLREFILPYDDMRHTSSPDTTLLEFAQSTYEAAAELADWERSMLERQEGTGFKPTEINGLGHTNLSRH